MSARLLGWAWKVPLTNVGGSAPSTQQLVLLALVDLTSDSGRTRPEASVAKLATMTRLGRGAITAALSALETQGVIVALNGRSGGRVATRWLLCVTRDTEQEDGSTAPEERGSTASQERGSGNQPRPKSADNRAPKEHNRAPGARVSLPSLPKPSLPRGSRARARARGTLRSWWDRQTPEPAQDFSDALNTCAAALSKGWADSDLTAALDALDGPPVTPSSLDLGRRRATNGAADDGAVTYRPLTAEEREAIHQTVVGFDERQTRRRAEREQR